MTAKIKLYKSGKLTATKTVHSKSWATRIINMVKRQYDLRVLRETTLSNYRSVYGQSRQPNGRLYFVTVDYI